MDGVALGEAVNHADDFGQKFFGVSLVLHFPEVFDSRARGLCVVAILQAALGNLTDALFCRKMMCHLFKLLICECENLLPIRSLVFLRAQR